MTDVALQTMTARPLPKGPISERMRQPVLDAAAVLQVRRSEIVRRLAAGACSGVEIVAVGHLAANQWLLDHGADWAELLSVRPSATAAQLRISVPLNRHFIAHGVQMISLFDYDGLDAGGRLLLANESVGQYLFGVGPIQMKILDREFVLLNGPEVGGEMSLMKVTARTCLDAAWRYWEAAVGSSVPVVAGGELAALTPRQRQIVALLATDLGDEAVATALGVSVRTVRSDIAVVLEKLGVRSRFAAGNRLRIWDEECHP